jgi:hypothetical protein
VSPELRDSIVNVLIGCALIVGFAAIHVFLHAPSWETGAAIGLTWAIAYNRGRITTARTIQRVLRGRP